LLTENLPSADKKDTGKCIEGAQKEKENPRQRVDDEDPHSFRNNGTAGDLLE
jgi:hypothetical protein